MFDSHDDDELLDIIYLVELLLLEDDDRKNLTTGRLQKFNNCARHACTITSYIHVWSSTREQYLRTTYAPRTYHVHVRT